MAGIIDKIAALGASAIISTSALESACATHRQPATTPKQAAADSQSLPFSVMSKWKDLSIKYGGATVWRCVKDSSIIVLVSGGYLDSKGDFRGEAFYYTENGDYIGSFTRSDVNKPESKQPVELEGYICDSVASSSTIASR